MDIATYGSFLILIFGQQAQRQISELEAQGDFGGDINDSCGLCLFWQFCVIPFSRSFAGRVETIPIDERETHTVEQRVTSQLSMPMSLPHRSRSTRDDGRYHAISTAHPSAVTSIIGGAPHFAKQQKINATHSKKLKRRGTAKYLNDEATLKRECSVGLGFPHAPPKRVSFPAAFLQKASTKQFCASHVELSLREVAMRTAQVLREIPVSVVEEEWLILPMEILAMEGGTGILASATKVRDSASIRALSEVGPAQTTEGNEVSSGLQSEGFNVPIRRRLEERILLTSHVLSMAVLRYQKEEVALQCLHRREAYEQLRRAERHVEDGPLVQGSERLKQRLGYAVEQLQVELREAAPFAHLEEQLKKLEVQRCAAQEGLAEAREFLRQWKQRLSKQEVDLRARLEEAQRNQAKSIDSLDTLLAVLEARKEQAAACATRVDAIQEEEAKLREEVSRISRRLEVEDVPEVERSRTPRPDYTSLACGKGGQWLNSVLSLPTLDSSISESADGDTKKHRRSRVPTMAVVEAARQRLGRLVADSNLLSAAVEGLRSACPAQLFKIAELSNFFQRKPAARGKGLMQNHMASETLAVFEPRTLGKPLEIPIPLWVLPDDLTARAFVAWRKLEVFDASSRPLLSTIFSAADTQRLADVIDVEPTSRLQLLSASFGAYEALLCSLSPDVAGKERVRYFNVPREHDIVAALFITALHRQTPLNLLERVQALLAGVEERWVLRHGSHEELVGQILRWLQKEWGVAERALLPIRCELQRLFILPHPGPPQWLQTASTRVSKRRCFPLLGLCEVAAMRLTRALVDITWEQQQRLAASVLELLIPFFFPSKTDGRLLISERAVELALEAATIFAAASSTQTHHRLMLAMSRGEVRKVSLLDYASTVRHASYRQLHRLMSENRLIEGSVPHRRGGGEHRSRLRLHAQSIIGLLRQETAVYDSEEHITASDGEESDDDYFVKSEVLNVECNDEMASDWGSGSVFGSDTLSQPQSRPTSPAVPQVFLNSHRPQSVQSWYTPSTAYGVFIKQMLPQSVLVSHIEASRWLRRNGMNSGGSRLVLAGVAACRMYDADDLFRVATRCVLSQFIFSSTQGK